MAIGVIILIFSCIQFVWSGFINTSHSTSSLQDYVLKLEERLTKQEKILGVQLDRINSLERRVTEQDAQIETLKSCEKTFERCVGFEPALSFNTSTGSDLKVDIKRDEETIGKTPNANGFDGGVDMGAVFRRSRGIHKYVSYNVVYIQYQISNGTWSNSLLFMHLVSS